MMKKGASMLLIAGLAIGVASCCSVDPVADDVTPPTVAVAPNTLTGVITSISGDALKDATVTLGTATATTDANGIYFFNDVKAGTLKIKVEATGKQTREDEITVANTGVSQALVWNTAMANDTKTEVTVSTTTETTADETTETLTGNDAAKVEIATVVPANAVTTTTPGEQIKIQIAPIYDASVANRATESVLMVGAAISCNKADAVLANPINLSFDMDADLASKVEARKLVNGQWVAAQSSVQNGKVIVVADAFTSYGLFLNVSFVESNGSSAVAFAQNKWDNLYGAVSMSVDAASYTYKVGTELTPKSSKLEALLVEKLAQRYGAKVSTVTGTYPLNVILPVGTMLSISGTQTIQTVTATAAGKSVSGTCYDKVSIVTATANRQHTGGSN